MKDDFLVDAACRYINAGLAVIALSGKMPNGKVHRQGLHDAISGTVETDEDRAQLAEYFDHPETTGVAIVIPEHLVVVDIDGEEGAVEFQRLAGSDIPDTAVAKTGRGLHLWYATPRVQGSTKLGPKLDLKGVGGYVAAPPSHHPDGHVYTWLDPLVVDVLDGEPVIAPIDWLPAAIEMLLADREAIAAENHVERPVYHEYNLSLHNGRWRLRRTPIPPPIDGLIATVRNAEPGARNNTLAWAVLQARDEGVTLEVALRDIGGAGIQAGLSDREVKATIRSAYRRSRKP